MKTKYEGNCKHCGKSWKVGDEIHFSKEPKAVCIDSVCFEKQKANIERAIQAGTSARLETTRTNYGQVPEWLNDQAENIKTAWKGYASLAASLVDEVQPTLDNRTRSMAVSAVIDQIIQMQKIKAIKELRSEKLE